MSKRDRASNIFTITWEISTPGTADQYELGDLGAKYGLLESRSLSTFYNDTQLSLFGPHSILGRSVVLHRKVLTTYWLYTLDHSENKLNGEPKEDKDKFILL